MQVVVFIGFVMLKGIDLWQTFWILSDEGRSRGFRELNPLIRSRRSAVVVMFANIVALFALVLALPYYADLLLMVSIVFVMIIVLRNMALGVTFGE